MMVFSVGDRVGSKLNGNQGTVKALPGPLLVTVEWDNGANQDHYHRMLRMLTPEEDRKHVQPTTINEGAHGHD